MPLNPCRSRRSINYHFPVGKQTLDGAKTSSNTLLPPARRPRSGGATPEAANGLRPPRVHPASRHQPPHPPPTNPQREQRRANKNAPPQREQRRKLRQPAALPLHAIALPLNALPFNKRPSLQHHQGETQETKDLPWMQWREWCLELDIFISNRNRRKQCSDLNDLNFHPIKDLSVNPFHCPGDLEEEQKSSSCRANMHFISANSVIQNNDL